MTTRASEYRTYSHSPYSQSDRESLPVLLDNGLVDAAIFHCARMVEGICSDALNSVRLWDPRNDLYIRLRILLDYNLIPRITYYLANAVRNLGNDVRHPGNRPPQLRPISEADSRVAVAFTRECIRWFESKGFGDSDIDAGWLPVAESTGALLDRLYTGDQCLPTLYDNMDAGLKEAFFSSPALACILGEALTQVKNPHGEPYYDLALSILGQAHDRFGDERRICQLIALCKSRTGEPVEALDWLDRTRADDETYGIRGGAYKRRWTPGDERTKTYLRNAHNAYSEGWRESAEMNPYLGINVATTSFFLDEEGWRRTAQDVAKLIEDRKKNLAKAGRDIVVGYWDQVTLAEAKLLLGDLEASEQVFSQAKEEHPTRDELFSITQRQLDLIRKKQQTEF